MRFPVFLLTRYVGGRCFTPCTNQTNRCSSSHKKGDGKTEKTGEDREKLEFPQIYVNKEVFDQRSSRVSNIHIRRLITEWKNDQELGKNWPETWSAPAPFNPEMFPLDIRMGKKLKHLPQPGKYENLELVKVQNFLHLTPPAIKRHCQALKKFCTEWPKELETDEDCEREFPVEIHTTDYVRSGQSQRNPNARITTLKIRLCHFVLNAHSRHKLIALAGDRYDPKTDILSITAERCPMRKQNRQYLDYLLTVLYFESWKKEHWESREFIEDQDGIYWWEDSNSYKNLIRILKSHSDYKSIFTNAEEDKISEDVKNVIEELPEVKKYRDTVVQLKLPDQNIKDEEKRDLMQKYKESVRTLLKLPELQ